MHTYVACVISMALRYRYTFAHRRICLWTWKNSQLYISSRIIFLIILSLAISEIIFGALGRKATLPVSNIYIFAIPFMITIITAYFIMISEQ